MGQHIIEVKDMMTKKCDTIKEDDCRSMAGYMKTMALPDARMAFRIKSNMIDLKANYKGKYRGGDYECDQCEGEVETVTHCLVCPGYREERENKDLSNDDDLVKYFFAVMKKREQKV